MTRPSNTPPQQGYEELLGMGAAIARGVARLGQGDKLRLELLIHFLADCRERLLAHRLLRRTHLA
jgi:hypothetical protein